MNPSWATLRYTGEYPSVQVLNAVPNWVPAFDEEAADGQDETTIQPEEQQSRISEHTAMTAADVIIPSGATIPALLRLSDGEFNSLWVFDPEGEWMLNFNGSTALWSSYEEYWRPAHQRLRRVLLTDAKVFPLVVITRLPVGYTERQWRIEIDATGRSVSNL